MPPTVRHAACAAVAAGLTLAGLTCAFPTDRSDEVTVLIQTPGLVVIRGHQLPLFARAIQVSGADTVDLRNVVFAWSSGNTNLATVQDDGGGYAQVTGVNSGLVEIIARAKAYESSDIGYLQLRVSNPLEVDSVKPDTVRFGDTVTVYGIGVDSIFLAFFENGTLLDYPLPQLPTRVRDSTGYSRATFWVPAPSRSSQLSFIGPGVFGSAPDSTRVRPFDVLEPNQFAPRTIQIDTTPPRFPTLPFFKFLNPALAFEIPNRDETGIEWYRFTQTVPRDLTLIISGPTVRGTFSTFLTDSLEFSGVDTTYVVGPTSWTIGPRSHFCRGFPFEPSQTQPESTIVALRGMPVGALHAIALYAQPGPYGLAVIEGYVTSDPAVPRDPHEEDDFCTARAADSVVATLPAGGFRDTLTIDNPHDVDWIRFRVTGPPGAVVTVRTAALTAAVGDTSDLDFYVLTVPGGGASSTLDPAMVSLGGGSAEQQTALLAPGDYYLVVVDYRGAPVAYAVCIDASGCAGFPSPPAAAVKRSAEAPRFEGGALRAPRPRP